MAYSVRNEWLDQVREQALDPERIIVDPHHHFFEASQNFQPYDLAQLRADTASHNVRQTVYLQCGEHHQQDGPDALKPVGETEWVDGIANEARKDPEKTQIGAMIGTADLRLGAAVREVLDAHQATSPLFRGIRQSAAWDPSDAIPQFGRFTDGELYRSQAFREGFAVLGEMGLSFDAWHYFHQTPYLTELAQAFPAISIVLDHFGTPLGVGPYADRPEAVFAQWASDLVELARCPNVSIKLGGLAMPWNGFGFEVQRLPPSSDELVSAQGRHYQHAIDAFGADRCMFESNFPVDKISVSYGVLWNAFKKIAGPYSEPEKDNLFRGTAARVYRLNFD